MYVISQPCSCNISSGLIIDQHYSDNMVGFKHNLQFSVAYCFCHGKCQKNFTVCLLFTALQAATIVVAMASGKHFWQPKFWQKSGDGDHFTVKGR